MSKNQLCVRSWERRRQKELCRCGASTCTVEEARDCFSALGLLVVCFSFNCEFGFRSNKTALCAHSPLGLTFHISTAHGEWHDQAQLSQRWRMVWMASALHALSTQGSVHSAHHGLPIPSARSGCAGLGASVFLTPSQRLEQGVVA